MKRFELWRDYGVQVYESDDLFSVIRVYESVNAILNRTYDILDTKSGEWLIGRTEKWFQS